jgi:hypothetical protein
MSRNGKIARLPHGIREELNERLHDGEDGSGLLDWLNGLPEVAEVLKTQFAGNPISKQNLSEWRLGGYREWAAKQELLAHAAHISDCAGDLESEIQQTRDNLLVDDLAAVMAAKYAGLISEWNGTVDSAFEARLRVFRALCHDIVELQRSMHGATKQNREWLRTLEDNHQRDLKREKERILAPIWAKLQEGTIAKLFGGGDAGQKIAEMITAVKFDLPLPGEAKQSPTCQTWSNPVKPSQTDFP